MNPYIRFDNPNTVRLLAQQPQIRFLTAVLANSFLSKTPYRLHDFLVELEELGLCELHRIQGDDEIVLYLKANELPNQHFFYTRQIRPQFELVDDTNLKSFVEDHLIVSVKLNIGSNQQYILTHYDYAIALPHGGE